VSECKPLATGKPSRKDVALHIVNRDKIKQDNRDLKSLRCGFLMQLKAGAYTRPLFSST